MSKKNAEAIAEENSKNIESQANKELKDIDILASELNIRDTILAGIMTMKNCEKVKCLLNQI